MISEVGSWGPGEMMKFPAELREGEGSESVGRAEDHLGWFRKREGLSAPPRAPLEPEQSGGKRDVFALALCKRSVVPVFLHSIILHPFSKYQSTW